jgi:hypothetical protein
MIWRMATPFDTDYSFLNLPGAGSDVRGPIELPSFQPKDSSFNLEKYAPRQLQNQRLVQPSLAPLSDLDSQNVLSSARPFEDIQSLGATFEQRLVETERFFGDRVNKLQGSIEQLTGEKDKLGQDLEAAFLQQDEMSQQAIEEQIAALDAQRAELVAQLESSVAEAEANGVDAVQAAEKVAAEQRQQFEGQLTDLDQQLQDLEVSKQEAIAAGNQQLVQELEAQQQQLTAQREQLVSQMEQQFGGERGEMQAKQAELEGQLQDIQAAQEQAIAERDQAIAEQDNIRAQAADEQVQALEGLKQQLLTERESIVGGLEGQIGDLQGEIDSLTGARDTAIGERDQAIAAQDTIRAEAADQQAQALDAQAGDYQAQLDQLTGQSTQYQGQVGERDQTIADLQSQIQALQATPATVATPAPSPITPPIDVKPIIDPNTGEEMTADRLKNLNPTIFGYGDFKGADPANIPVYTPPTASSMPTFIPQSVRDAVGNVPAPAQDPVIRMYDKEPLPPPQQLRPPLTKPNLPALKPIAKPTPSLLAPKPIASPIQRMPQMRMGKMQPRMMMAEGDEVKSFADYQPEGSLKGTFFDYIPDGYQVSSFLIDKFGQEAAQNPTIREMFEKEFKAARMAGKDVFEFMGKPYNTKTLEEVEGMMYGGEMKRYANGGEIENMLSGMDSGEQEAMGELEQMAPEMEMIDQLVNMVVQMIQQGAGEEQVISFLREQGLDDEDIGTVLQLVAEMAETEEVAAQNEIGSDLEQLG